MKYIITSILFLVVTSCFAVDSKLTYAKEQYSNVETRLSRIENKIESTKKNLETALRLLKWEQENDKPQPEAIINKSQEVEEKQNLLNALVTQQIETEKLLQKLEPLKKGYDKQSKLDDERKNLIESLVTVIFILTIIAFFGAIAYFVISHQIKYWRLLKSGKISQEEYDRLTRSSIASTDNNMGVNSATGLPMTGIGISDVGGNVRGSSPIKSSFDYSQDYSSRHRWD